jgi:nucleotide-binding universal stress UspA family protein
MSEERCERRKVPFRSDSLRTLDAEPSDSGSAPRILYATAEPTPDGDCLDRAHALAEVLHAHLEVWSMGLTRLAATSDADAASAGEEDSEAQRLPAGRSASAQRDARRRDGFVQRVAARAREVNAILLILPGSERPAARATAMVRATGRPVLVARPRMASGAILAATDLTDPRYPIVRQAGRLGALNRVSVVALHNVLPSCIELETRAPWPAALRPDPDAMTHQLQALVGATREHRVATAILTALIDPVDAILREARASRPDLVVVGTRPRCEEASGRRSVSAQLVNLLRQSVLIMPCSPSRSDEEPSVLLS